MVRSTNGCVIGMIFDKTVSVCRRAIASANMCQFVYLATQMTLEKAPLIRVLHACRVNKTSNQVQGHEQHPSPGHLQRPQLHTEGRLHSHHPRRRQKVWAERLPVSDRHNVPLIGH